MINKEFGNINKLTYYKLTGSIEAALNREEQLKLFIITGIKRKQVYLNLPDIKCFRDIFKS